MEAMQDLYYRDPYAREFTAEVLECVPGKKGFEVVLTDTAFYPEGGGQPSDTGRLGEATVSFVKKTNGKIIHYTDKPLEAGAQVVGKIDWDKRFDNMQNHTCEHIFSGLVHKRYGFENVGFHMDPDDITVDFSGEIPAEEIPSLEKEVNAAISADIDLRITFPSGEELKTLPYRSKKELTGVVRIVSVPGCDCCACCGTHVRRSGEIGLFKVLEASKHRGGTRVRFVSGERALRDYARKVEEVSKVSAIFSAKPNEIAKAAQAFVEEAHRKEQKASLRADRYFRLLAVSAEPTDGKLILFEEDLNPFELKRFAGILKEYFPEAHLMVLSAASNGYNYVIASDSEDLADRSKKLNKALNGRGGGREGLVQGTYRADKEQIEKAFNELF